MRSEGGFETQPLGRRAAGDRHGVALNDRRGLGEKLRYQFGAF
jgi:hypothetical protein